MSALPVEAQELPAIEERFCRKAPFPWFGGKSKAAPLVWRLLGDVEHYCEPFAGSLAVLLGRPHPCNRPYYSETVNDLDGFIVNMWRSLALSPQATAEAASWPVTEADKSARQIHLLRWLGEHQEEILAGDPNFHDPVIAGWWLWAVAVQIGAFAGDGAWTADPATGRIIKMPRGAREPGVWRDRLDLSGNGRGVNNQTLREPGVSRDKPHISDDGQGVNLPGLREPGVVRNKPHLANDGRGVNYAGLREPGVWRDRPHLIGNGQGVNYAGLRAPGVGDEDHGYHPMTMPKLRAWFALLSARLRHVRILNGDWSRLCTSGSMHTLSVRQGGFVGVFLDPPYSGDVRASGLYARDGHTISDDVRAWCVANGGNPKNRIVLCGYDSEHVELERYGWRVHEWFVRDSLLVGGLGNQSHRERIWSSPHCLPLESLLQPSLFAAANSEE